MSKLAIELRHRRRLGGRGDRSLHLRIAYDITGAYDHGARPVLAPQDCNSDRSRRLISIKPALLPVRKNCAPMPSAFDQGQCPMLETA